jgi:hypothetical protein
LCFGDEKAVKEEGNRDHGYIEWGEFCLFLNCKMDGSLLLCGQYETRKKESPKC